MHNTVEHTTTVVNNNVIDNNKASVEFITDRLLLTVTPTEGAKRPLL